MHSQNTDPKSPLFAPEWPAGEPSPTRAMRRLEYIDAHAPTGTTAAHHATIIANRMMGFDRAMQCDHPAGYANLLTGDCTRCGS